MDILILHAVLELIDKRVATHPPYDSHKHREKMVLSGSSKSSRMSIVREPGEHKVTFTVTLACAVQAVESDAPMIEAKKGKRLAIYEKPKAHHYFHLEYKLMPDDLDPVKTDVVMYGVAAKIYNENDSKVMKTWKEGEKIWIAWTQNVSIWVNKELLLNIFDHTLDLRIWDSKEKVSTRARFDRPKAFRLPAGKENEEDAGNHGGSSNVRALVVKQSLSYMQLQPKESREMKGERLARTTSGAVGRHQDYLTTTQGDEMRATTAPTGSFEVPAASAATRAGDLAKIQVRIQENSKKHWHRIAQLAGLSEPMSEDEMARLSDLVDTRKTVKVEKDKRKKLKVDEMDKDPKPKRKSKREEQKLAIIAAFARTHGIASIKLRLSLLFAGTKSITQRLGCQVNGIEDLMVTVSLDKPLLSEEQMKDLNPMVLKLSSANDLPNKPLSYTELQEKCVPVFAQYKFFKQPMHCTLGYPHGRNVYWDDVNVVLLGILDQGELEEFLQGPPLQIEIHDRDRNNDAKKVKADLFGENPEDEMINNVSLVAGRRTTHNPFEGKGRAWDPYGVAKLDLSELLLSQRYLYMSIPIHNCSSPDPTVGHDRPGGSIVGHAGSVDGPEDEPLPSSSYIEAGSELKLKVEVGYPLTTAAQVRQRVRDPDKVQIPTECPFTRVIYVFDYTNTTFLKELQNEITEINATALELMNLPEHIIDAALSTYKLSEDQKASKILNILTGFQIIDGVRHMFVLEGLRDEGMKHLVQSMRLDREDSDPGSVKALYKSDMTFSERLYASLDVDLCRVRLHDCLTNITRKPLLYVRDIVPRPCFEGLTRLDKILNASKLREVVKNDLFPTPEMILSVSREFGIPLTAEDFGETAEGENVGYMDDIDGENSQEPPQTKRRIWTPLQLKNPEFRETLKNRENTSRDFISENVVRTQTKSPRQKPESIAVTKTELDNCIAHNYSTQSLNSTELSKQKLKEILSKDPSSLYTYCSDYNSASLVTTEESAGEINRDEEKQKWLTPEGFIVSSPKTALESYRHPLKPGSARVMELNKAWRENILHANILKPTVDRIVFPWRHRDKDMDTITQPADAKYLGSIHLYGDAREHEKLDAAEKDMREWESRVVVDDVRLRTHRCLPRTELSDKGTKSANALSKLEDILKDPPEKFSLKEGNLKLDKIPPLSTVVGGTGRRGRAVDETKHGGYKPGPLDERSWLMEGNRIPVTTEDEQAKKEKDFTLVFKTKTNTYRRSIKPLLPQERETHLFPTDNMESLSLSEQPSKFDTTET